MLGCFAGVDVYSVTITVAAFMGGLGCGSAVGGHLADRLAPGRRLFVFCAAEAVIAIFALLSKWLYYDLLYLRWSGFGDSPVLLPVILFLSLLCPTFCMGVTLPILAKSFTAKVESASSVIGYLYGVNTLGAAAGAFTTIWILLRRFGFEEILQFGAILNAVSAAGAALVWWWLGSVKAAGIPSTEKTADEGEIVEPAHFPIPIWMSIYAMSGFVALALEIVWFRVFGIVQKSTSFTFGNLLGVYLIGLALGVIAGVPFAKRIRRPTRAFLALQMLIPLYAAGTIALLVRQVDSISILKPLWTYLQGYEPLNPTEMIAALPAWLSGSGMTDALRTDLQLFNTIYFLLPLLLIAPATFLMGLSFPLLQRAVQSSPALIGRRVGWLQTMNICGSLLGATLVGWGALRYLGTPATLRLLVYLGGIFALLFAWQSASKWTFRFGAALLALFVLILVAGLVPSGKIFWARLHGTRPDLVVIAESDSGLSLLKSEQPGMPPDTVWIFTNGLGQSWLPYGSIHTQIGMLGAILHPNPEEIAVIGLGSGDTVYALGGSPKTSQVTCIEIVRPVHDNLSVFAGQNGNPALQTLLGDTRMQWLFTDARTYLQRSGKLFDIIEADALRPNSAYAGNLYSEEYFRMIKAHLKPGGHAVSWAPTARTLKTFLHVFPHAIVVNGIAVGGEEAIDIDLATIARRMGDPFTVEHYRQIGMDVRPLLRDLFLGRFDRYNPETTREPATDLNSDLYPRDEFGVPQS